jgi:hypothetical protein
MVAVSTEGSAGNGSRREVAVFDTKNWEIIAKFPIDADGLSFSHDGRLLAIAEVKTDERKRVVACGIQIREIPSGALVSEWWKEVRDACPKEPVFLDGEPPLLLALDSGGSEIRIWDAKEGTLRRQIRSPRPITGFLVSPHGDWVITNVSNDPQDTPDNAQDFVVWDLRSGAILYESPKEPWRPLEKLFDAMARSALRLNSLSADGRLLLVTRHKKLVVYEILRSDTAKKGN